MREVQDFLVRVLGNSGSLPFGCGFLVGTDKRHVLTCCHVVNAALKRHDVSKPSVTVFLNFPFLAPNVPCEAEIECWHYETAEPLHDICVLRLLDDAPSNAQPAPMVRANDYSGDTFRAFGFPQGLEDNGREVRGVLGAKQVNGRVLAEGISQFGYFIEQGFSGTPIWNSTRGGVCGMAFQVDMPASVKVASIVPTQQLTQVAHELIELSGAIPSYLRRLIADLETRRGVLQYIDLSAHTDVSKENRTSSFDIDDEFGFSELVQRPQSSEKETVKLGKIRDVLDNYQRFVLIGEAGSSKTTTLRRLALEAARKRMLDDSAALPLLLNLPRWEYGLSPAEFIRGQWVAAGLPEDDDPIQLLKTGAVLLYLDGLNEMGGYGAENAKKLKTWLASSESPRFVIVTCRKDNYLGDFEVGLPIVQIEPMSEELIQIFVRNYLSTRADALLRRVLPLPHRVNNDPRHLFYLARNPYMLAALIIVFEEADEAVFPDNSGQLIQLLVRALAKRETKRQSAGWTPFETSFVNVTGALSNLAFAMTDDNRGTEVDIDFVYKYIDRVTLQAAESANYISRSDNKLRFYHQLMEEYFASLSVGKHRTKIIQQIRSPVPINGQDISSGLNNYARWENIIATYVELTADKKYLREIAEINPFFACELVSNGEIWLPSEVIDEIVEVNFAAAVLYSHNTNFRVPLTALSLLGEQGLPSLAKGLGHNLHPIREVAAGAIGEVVSSASFNYEKYDNRVSLWNDMYHDLLQLDVETYIIKRPSLSVIKQLVGCLNDDIQSVRHAAALSLLQCGWKPEHINERISFYIAIRNWNQCARFGVKALTQLARVLLDEDSEIRRHAADTIWTILNNAHIRFDTHTGTVIAEMDTLSDSTTFDTYLSTEQKIAFYLEQGNYRAIADLGIANAAFLIDRLAQGDNSGRIIPPAMIDVGYVSAKALAIIGAEAFPYLTAAVKDRNKIRRSNAALALVLSGTEGIAQTLMLLDDDAWSVRQICVWALGEGIHNHNLSSISIKPKLLRALRDKSPHVRGAALRSLVSIVDETDIKSIKPCLWDRRFFKPEIYYYIVHGFMHETRVCDMASAALKKIGTKSALKSLATWERFDHYLSLARPIWEKLNRKNYNYGHYYVNFDPNQE